MRARGSLLGLVGCVLPVLGCNAVLDNGSAILAAPDAATATAGYDGGAPLDSSVASAPPLDATSPVDAPAVAEAAPPDAAPPPVSLADAATVPTCATGQKLCSGSCAPVDDPFFGCSPTGCTPCSLEHATTTCAGASCAIEGCDPGYADCDQKAPNGCEVDLSEPSHCGACNAICAAGAPDCAPTAAGFVCTTGCAASAPTLCGEQCVNILTSVDDCGGCDNPCPAVVHGQASCASGHCGFACQAGFHVCGESCASSVDPGSCGASCAPCPAAAHAIATCDGTTCGTECLATFADCDGNAANGCEADLLTDPSNCGACGAGCDGRTCEAGACAPIPDAGPPDAGPPPPEDSSAPPPIDAAPGADSSADDSSTEE